MDTPLHNPEPMPKLFLGVDYLREPLFFRIPSPRAAVRASPTFRADSQPPHTPAPQTSPKALPSPKTLPSPKALPSPKTLPSPNTLPLPKTLPVSSPKTSTLPSPLLLSSTLAFSSPLPSPRPTRSALLRRGCAARLLADRAAAAEAKAKTKTKSPRFLRFAALCRGRDKEAERKSAALPKAPTFAEIARTFSPRRVPEAFHRTVGTQYSANSQNLGEEKEAEPFNGHTEAKKETETAEEGIEILFGTARAEENGERPLSAGLVDSMNGISNWIEEEDKVEEEIVHISQVLPTVNKTVMSEYVVKEEEGDRCVAGHSTNALQGESRERDPLSDETQDEGVLKEVSQNSETVVNQVSHEELSQEVPSGTNGTVQGKTKENVEEEQEKGEKKKNKSGREEDKTEVKCLTPNFLDMNVSIKIIETPTHSVASEWNARSEAYMTTSCDVLEAKLTDETRLALSADSVDALPARTVLLPDSQSFSVSLRSVSSAAFSAESDVTPRSRSRSGELAELDLSPPTFCRAATNPMPNSSPARSQKIPNSPKVPNSPKMPNSPKVPNSPPAPGCDASDSSTFCSTPRSESSPSLAEAERCIF